MKFNKGIKSISFDFYTFNNFNCFYFLIILTLKKKQKGN